MSTGLKSNRAILRRYRMWAPRYDRLWSRYSDVTLSEAERMVVEHVCQPSALLDVACGTGLFARRMRQRFPHLHITGVDLSPHMLRQARDRMSRDRNVKWIESSAESMPVGTGAFDVITCNNAFHLVRDQPRALAEFRRALKDTGTLIIVDWNRDAASIKFVSFQYKVFGDHPRTIMTADELARKVNDAGFEIVNETRFSATWFWKLAAVVGRKRN